MKLLAVIFCLMVSVNALGQGSGTSHVDTSKKFMIRDFYYNENEKILYVINNKSIYTKPSEKMIPDTNDILDVHVLIGKDAIIKYGKKAKNGAITITTKAYAIQKYQQKFSSFSKKYREYLKSHQNNDEGINYVLYGDSLRFLSVKPKERTKALYEVAIKKVKAVEFMENQFYNGGDSRPYNVIIATKK